MCLSIYSKHIGAQRLLILLVTGCNMNYLD